MAIQAAKVAQLEAEEAAEKASQASGGVRRDLDQLVREARARQEEAKTKGRNLQRRLDELEVKYQSQVRELAVLRGSVTTKIQSQLTRPKVSGLLQGRKKLTLEDLEPLSFDAQRLAGTWIDDDADLEAEHPLFRGYFMIGATRPGSEGADWPIGAIVRGYKWDRTKVPRFTLLFGPEEDVGQELFSYLKQMTYLGPTWSEAFIQLANHLRSLNSDSPPFVKADPLKFGG